MPSITLEMGALCDPISKQLAGYAPVDKLKPLDELADALTLCYIRGIISDAEVDRSRKRLMKLTRETVEQSARDRRANTKVTHDPLGGRCV